MNINQSSSFVRSSVQASVGKTDIPASGNASDGATAPQSVDVYLKALQERHPTLDLSIGPNPKQGTQKNTVGISRTYLQKCMEDPELAKKLEYDLGTMPMALQAKEGWAARDGVELIGGGTRIADDGSMSAGYGGMMVTRQSKSSTPATYSRSKTSTKKTEAARLEERQSKRRAEDKKLQEKLLAQKLEKKKLEEDRLAARIDVTVDSDYATPDEAVEIPAVNYEA
ncbi:MAG: DUF6033 family protein [Planctomycetaceae bacterium]|nr:DUF6033 family protein [Planctomycetaceae bacterium]